VHQSHTVFGAMQVDKCKAAQSGKKAKAQQAAAQQGQQQQQQEVAGPSRVSAAPPAGGSKPGKTPGYNVAYVGNIAFEVEPQELQQLFSPYGVTKVRLHTDMVTGKSKGYAHVHFDSEEGLDR
jgi:nucleolin